MRLLPWRHPAEEEPGRVVEAVDRRALYEQIDHAVELMRETSPKLRRLVERRP